MIDDATVITIFYSLSVVGLLVGVGIVYKLLQDESVDNDRGQFAWLLVIPGFAALSYLAMTLRIGVVEIDGNQVFLFRYIDWLVTTPILVGYVGYVAGAPRKLIIGVAGADALMILTGLGAVLATGIGTWIGFGISAVFHLTLLVVLYLSFPKYAKAHPERYRLFKILQNHVGLLWIAYPVVWLTSLAGFGYLSVVGMAMVIAYLDVIAKTPYVYFVWRERHSFAPETLEQTHSGSESIAGTPADD